MAVRIDSGPIAIPSDATGFHGAWLRGEPAALAFLPRHPSRRADWEARLAEAAATEPAPEVFERARDDGERLGADELARANAHALSTGDALCVTTGQQPGLFLGPLYTVWKAMTAVAWARRLGVESGRRIVPVFWNAADDSDFGEVGRAFFPGEAFRLTRHALEGGELPAGGMVGDLSTEGTRHELAGLEADWAGRPRGAALLAHLEASLARAGDHGELATALLHELFAGTGLVVVDGRWPELRRAAAPLLGAWADRREEATRSVVEAGQALEAAGFRAHISDASAERGVFEIRGGVRLPFEGTPGELGERTRSAPETLSWNVTLRSLVQDRLLPNVATVGGPGEISYHAQLVGVYELLGVGLPVPVPRFEATLVPAGVRRLAERRGADLGALVRDFDGALQATAARALPEPLAIALDDFDTAFAHASDRVRLEAAAFDPKLEKAAAEARRRSEEAQRKLREKISAAVRAEESRRDPAVKNYREFLRPRGVPQERVVSALTLFLEGRGDPFSCLAEALDRHVDATREGVPDHWLLDLDACPEEKAS